MAWYNRSNIYQAVIDNCTFMHCRRNVSAKFTYCSLKSQLTSLRHFLKTEIPLKIVTSVFYFMFKAPFVLKILTFLSWLFGYVKNNFIRRFRLIPKFLTLQTGQQIITIHILPNISRSKGNQAVKFGRLIKYNVKDTFLQNSYRKWGRETSSITFSVF